MVNHMKVTIRIICEGIINITEYCKILTEVKTIKKFFNITKEKTA